MRNSTNCNSGSSTNNNKNVTTTTVTDHNKVPRVEKVVFDNRIKRKNVLALNEKVAAIREYEKRPVYKRIGRMFQCSPDQIKRIVQQKDTILTAWEQRTRKSRDAKTLEMKVVRVSMLGKAVYEWIRRMLYYKDIIITDGLIQKMALQFKSAMGLQTFFPHQEWCDKFRSTYKIFTCDSKGLNIAYTQGHSVQIKDVMKDVLSECCPNEGDEEDNEMENVDDMDDDDDDDDCESVESDEARVKSKGNTNVRDKLKAKLSSKNKQLTVLQAQPTPMAMPTAMQNLRQFVTLPMQGNSLAGMGQKVLVATPIVGPGQTQGNGPMTMTIIPLATLGQHQNAINATQMVTQQLNVNCYNQPPPASSVNKSNDDVVIPPPLLEIKQEIKEEPREVDDNLASTIAQQEQDHIKIKREYLTDDEEDDNERQKPPTTPAATSRMPALLPAHVVSIPIHNKDMLEDSSKDSLDELTLSSLKKRMKIEELSSDEQDEDATQQKSHDTRTQSPAAAAVTTVVSTPPLTSSISNIPPMPPLTKAPTLNSSSSSSSSVPTSQATTTCLANSRKRTNSGETHNIQDLPAIRSFGEARKYLKLLEDFALERENFRLIGLITRADEVLRELDRKETSEGDNEDVEID